MMHHANSKPSGANSRNGRRRTRIQILARRAGVPEFMVRIAQERSATIPEDRVTPRYRHD